MKINHLPQILYQIKRKYLRQNLKIIRKKKLFNVIIIYNTDKNEIIKISHNLVRN